MYGVVTTGRENALNILKGIISVAALYERHAIVQNQNLLTLHRMNGMPESVK